MLQHHFSELRGSVNAGLTRNGVITLEFYERKKARWPFAAELFTWEVRRTVVISYTVIQRRSDTLEIIARGGNQVPRIGRRKFNTWKCGR